jgi:L-ascorbate metabolism protein UlaG (beta-lactamase superfamily)
MRFTQEETAYLPGVLPDTLKRIKALKNRDFILWIGHNSFLIRIGGAYWLIDPIFSERALLPKRVTPPALRADELRALTDNLNVIITHNHYDHLDGKSIEALPEKTVFYVPLGIKKLIRAWHGGEVNEMDWWEHIDIGEARLVCLPAQHWSRRFDQGLNESLWAGYMLIAGGRRFYIAGDTGNFVGFREFGRRFGGIDYAFMPITAYHPRWFMHYSHIDIPEAVQAFGELGADYFIPAQWGTFPMGKEPPGYPGLDLRRYIKAHELNASRFLILDIGGIVELEKLDDNQCAKTGEPLQ